MGARGQRVEVRDLVVLDFRSRYLTPEISDWKEHSAVPNAESCARQVWYGRTQDFEDFPTANSKHITRLEGAKAYELLLSVISGYHSAREMETHIRHQFMMGWRAFERCHPDKAPQFKSLIKQLRTDATFIHDNITNGWKPQRLEYAAIDLSGQKKGDQILIVGNQGRSGIMSPLTRELIKVSESRQKPHRNFLTITHHDPEVLEQFRKEVAQLQRDRVVRLDISFVPLDEIAPVLESSDCVYVATAMRDFPDADAALIEMWQGRVRQDGTLTHLRGMPTLRGATVEPWADADLKNFVRSEDIREEMVCRFRDNKAVRERALHAYEIFSQLREEGKAPRHNMSSEQAAELELA